MLSTTSPVILIGGGLLLLALLVLLLISTREKKQIKDQGEEAVLADIIPETKEETGRFDGLLTDLDFEYEHENPLVELYRRQWVKEAPGAQKDHYLLQYLAFRQLNDEKEAQAQENDEAIEWTEEETSARLDEILGELSEKTGLQLIPDDSLLFEMEEEVALSELDDYTDEIEKYEEEEEEEDDDWSWEDSEEDDTASADDADEEENNVAH